MAPVHSIASPRLLSFLSLAAHSLLALFRDSDTHVQLFKRDDSDFQHGCHRKCIAFAVLIPVLVLLSGLFAGLTLGYMSLDQTQLNVLSVSGTPDQKKYARAIQPIRENGHLLLVTLLLANMIVNESLPVIADSVLGGGVQSVVVSTVLIVIFAEIIPQSLFTRHGLYLGAKGAGLTRVLIYLLGVIAWPVAKLLDWILGSNHGIIYRRAELKELIAMHSSLSAHGGDLKSDTVTIIGATLDLQEKVVHQAMTPISDVFMLHTDAKLDYDLLKQIVDTGHSRIPVYEEVDLPDSFRAAFENTPAKAKKILGILLVKQCVLLDPKDATPIRSLQLNRVPHVPNNESLLGILDKFQEGRSHMAIVTRFSIDKAQSVKKAVKRGLTQRLRERVGMGDSSSDSEDENDKESLKKLPDGEETLKDDGVGGKELGEKRKNTKENSKENVPANGGAQAVKKGASFQISNLEQSMPADAVLAKEDAEQFLQGLDPAIMPLGIITLEDVLEELIGEEIYDEFDAEGAHGEPILHHHHHPTSQSEPPATLAPVNKSVAGMRTLSFFRSRSAPPQNRDGNNKVTKAATTSDTPSSDVPPVPDVPNASEALPIAPGLSVMPGEITKSKSGPMTVVDPAAVSTPTLEAILFNRRRKLTGSGSAAIVGSSRPRAGTKGKFKSTPLSIDTVAATKAVGLDSGPPTEVIDHEALEAEYLRATRAET